jgi:hypothetical protein
MFEWLSANKEWMFSGLGVTVLAGVVAIFKLLGSRKQPAQPATVVFRVENPVQFPPTVVQNASPTVPVTPPAPVSAERITTITQRDISDAIDAAPPLQRDAVAERFKGVKIEWDTSLRSGYERAGEVHLRLRVREINEPAWFDVECKVRLSDYRELGILPQGSLIRVYGEITKATSFSVELTNVRLLYIEPAKGK